MDYIISRKDLKSKKASDFKEGDIIVCSKYFILIKYGTYDRPSLMSHVENKNNGKPLDCTPGCGTPYYIIEFLSR